MAQSELSTASNEPFLDLDATDQAVNYSSTKHTTTATKHDTISAASFDPNEAPPPYSPENNWKLTYVDFTPKCLSTGGILSSPSFQTFDELVAKANDYLLRHPNTCVKSMETTRFTVSDVKKPGVVVDARIPTMSDSVSATGFLIHGLRMWIIPKMEGDATQVGYINVVPACLSPGGILKRPVFDSMAETVKKLNSLLDNTPLPGRILNVETVPLLFRQYSTWIEPDRCHWRRYNDLSSCHLYFIRLYYEACDAPHPTHLGYKDFVPMTMSKSHRLLHPTEKYESVHDLGNHAATWLSKQHDLSTINVETTYYKVKKGKGGRKNYAETEKTLSVHYGSSEQLQCLRLWFSDLHEGLSHHQASLAPSSIQCRMFCPEQVVEGGMFSSPVFESMLETRQRLKDWAYTYPDIRILCAETVPVKLHSGVPEEMWSSITHHRGNLDYHSMYIMVLRVYVCMMAANDTLVYPSVEVLSGLDESEEENSDENHVQNTAF